MSAFGRRNGMGGRPSFGTAKPMKGPAPATPAGEGGAQFPPIEGGLLGEDEDVSASAPQERGDAMARLADRQAQSGEAASSRHEGFEASIHRIKEQVLPRLLERVDPEAAATLSKDELAEEFRPIIGEVLAELKINLNRREQFALEKVLVDELLGLGPLEELLNDPDVSDIMVNGPMQTFVEKKGKLQLATIQFRDGSICSRSPSGSSTRSAAVSTKPRRSPTRASRTAAASTSSSRRSACAAPPSRSVNSRKSRSRST
jgi:pilus assembly protein CpaF